MIKYGIKVCVSLLTVFVGFYIAEWILWRFLWLSIPLWIMFYIIWRKYGIINK